MFNKFILSSFLGFMFVIGASGANAEMMSPSTACNSDMQKYCSGAQPGTPAMGKCIKDNHDKFSDNCKEQMKMAHAEMKKMREELSNACKSDVQKLCGDVKMGGGRIMKCLKENEGQLSAPCKTAREEMHTKFKAKQAAGEAAK